jgi:hypothetical protein
MENKNTRGNRMGVSREGAPIPALKGCSAKEDSEYYKCHSENRIEVEIYIESGKWKREIKGLRIYKWLPSQILYLGQISVKFAILR